MYLRTVSGDAWDFLLDLGDDYERKTVLAENGRNEIMLEKS